MPQPLENRIQAALGPRARAQTVADLLPEIDAAIAEAEAENAAKRVASLKAQRDQVQARHTELMNTDRRKRMLDEHAQIRDRRDALANDLRVQWPKLVDQMVGLLHRIKASDAEIETFQVRGVPAGCEWLASAEAVARDCPANFRDADMTPIPRFTEITLPRLDGLGMEELAWPDTRPEGCKINLNAILHAAVRPRRQPA